METAFLVVKKKDLFFFHLDLLFMVNTVLYLLFCSEKHPPLTIGSEVLIMFAVLRCLPLPLVPFFFI